MWFWSSPNGYSPSPRESLTSSSRAFLGNQSVSIAALLVVDRSLDIRQAVAVGRDHLCLAVAEDELRTREREARLLVRDRERGVADEVVERSRPAASSASHLNCGISGNCSRLTPARRKLARPHFIVTHSLSSFLKCTSPGSRARTMSNSLRAWMQIAPGCDDLGLGVAADRAVEIGADDADLVLADRLRSGCSTARGSSSCARPRPG